MPDFCTCGAELPPDAVFCHKCGKPQREIGAQEPEPEPDAPVRFTPTAAPPPEAPPVQAAPPTFRNPVAVKISLLVAFIAAILFIWVPFLNWLAGGFFSVFFYRKKTRGLLNLNAGLRLGWITGVMMFVMWLLIAIAPIMTGQLAKLIEEQAKSVPSSDPAAVQQMIQFLYSGPGISVLLAMAFVLITCFSMAGAALGAKLVGRE